MDTPLSAVTRFSRWIRDPRILEVLCLWSVIAGVGVYLAHTVAAGL